MRIKEITLEGFKSYSNRITVGPFADQFNALTGANGSGKSNLFDGIRFCMGFRVGEGMRVASTEELIYKRGQAGITSAAVTIIFDNSNPRESPPMYSGCPAITVTRQIAVGGRDRFFVNGHVKKVTEVVKMFQEAKLNIHQPHFVVMQGHVQRVIGMKPRELLELFQEAVGTNVFDKEREKCERTLNDKQEQLKSIEKDITESLEPSLEHAKREKRNYVRWLALGSQIPSMRFLWTAKRHVCAELAIKTCQTRISALKVEKDNLDRQRINLKNQIIDSSEAINRIKTQITFAAENPELRRLQTELQIVQTKVNELRVQDQLAQELLAAEHTALSRLDANVIKQKNALAAFETTNAKHIQQQDQCQQEQTESDAGLKMATEKYNRAKRGQLVVEDGRLVNDVIVELKSKLAENASQTAAVITKLSEHRNTIRDLQSATESNQGGYQSKIKELQEARSRREGLLQKIELSQYSNEKERALEEKVADLKRECDEQETQCRSLRARFEREEKILSHFPDRQRVAGPVMDLFRVKTSCNEYQLALEEAAKGRLLNLVLGSDDVSNEVFEWSRKNNLRVTCLPLNRVTAKPLDPDTVQRAKDVAQDNGHLIYFLDAIEIGIKEHKMPMCYAFSNAFLAENSVTAKAVNALERWTCPTITKNGDNYNPVGQISGGSTAGMDNIIQRRRTYLDLKESLAEKNSELRTLIAQTTEMQAAGVKHGRMVTDLKTVEATIAHLETIVELSKSTSTEGRLEFAKEAAAECEVQMKTLSTSKVQLEQELHPLREAEAKFRRDPEKEVKRLEKEWKKAVSRSEEAKEALRKLCTSLDELRQKHSMLKENLSTAEADLDKCRNMTIIDAVNKAQKAQHDLQEKEKEQRVLTRQLEEMQKTLAVHQTEIQRLQNLIKELEQQLETISETGSLHEKQIRDARTEMEAQKKMESITQDELNKLKVTDQAVMVEVENEHGHKSLEEIKQIMDEMTRERSKLQMKIDRKAINLQSQIEKDFELLKKDQQRVEEERDAVIRLICNIDEQKKKELDSAFVEVDKMFSKIFNVLLPGATAQLLAVDPANLQKGLEISVSLGGLRKCTLSDLSGGQKSLLALSLILSLLKLNPAPFYILDEVDAALDISHTENLGILIKKYFSESQFVIVSHRDTFYGNADVLFQASFANGSSRVTRIASA